MGEPVSVRASARGLVLEWVAAWALEWLSAWVWEWALVSIPESAAVSRRGWLLVWMWPRVVGWLRVQLLVWM